MLGLLFFMDSLLLRSTYFIRTTTVCLSQKQGVLRMLISCHDIMIIDVVIFIIIIIHQIVMV